ncbi:Flp family type IVb pilin [Virgibacillus xinjiangensis]|uniref:Flp family type IVb pilin n=1 Tax=Virgibacillus xinjiangensis TaxID=393090 RepID=A0ABV7CYI5_9BACI
MLNKVKGLFVEEQGQGMTEYGLILGLIAVGVITVIATLGDQIVGVFTDITSKITNNGITGTDGT